MDMLDKSKKSAEQVGPVVVKKYANRRLYNTDSSTYVTLEDLAQMVRADRDFVVYDAKSGDDLTHSVLTQIIVEQESRSGGQTLLPIPFLRQLIRFYDDSMGNMVPGYLQFSLEALARQQDEYRKKFANAWSATSLEAYQEQARTNLKIFEEAMSIWTPFKLPDGTTQVPGKREAKPEPTDATEKAPENEPREGKPTESKVPEAKPTESRPTEARPTEARPPNEIDALKSELKAMQERIEKLSQNR